MIHPVAGIMKRYSASQGLPNWFVIRLRPQNRKVEQLHLLVVLFCMMTKRAFTVVFSCVGSLMVIYITLGFIQPTKTNAIAQRVQTRNSLRILVADSSVTNTAISTALDVGKK